MDVQGRNGNAESAGIHRDHTGNRESEVLRVDESVGVKSLVVLCWEMVFDLFGHMADCADEGNGVALKPTVYCQLCSTEKGVDLPEERGELKRTSQYQYAQIIQSRDINQ